MTKSNIDKWHKHEALDRTIMFANIIEENLYNSPFIASSPKIRAKIGMAIQELNDAYQLIGETITDDNKKLKIPEA